LSDSLLNNRQLQRWALGTLRRVLPVARFGNNVVVTPFDAVTDLLKRPKDFSVVKVYDDKMKSTSGAFYLGMDDTSRYRRERDLTNRALKAMDLDWYRQLAREYTAEALREPLARGQLDLVQDLSWLVPIRLCEEFFGVTGPDRRSLARWVRYIFQHLFLNLNDDPVVAKRAERLSIELKKHVDQSIVEIRAELANGGSERRDFLSQLVRLQNAAEEPFSEEAIRRNVAGVFLGSVDTVSRAVANAVEELFSRQPELQRAQRAARAGDRDTVAKYVFEALRFNPHNPLVVRHAARDTEVVTGKRSVPVPKGCRVFAMTYAAMFDPKRYEKPSAFLLDRGDLSHLQFGYGFHRCFGEHLARTAVVEMVTAVLQLPGLRRPPGEAGKLIFDGPFPDHLPLTFDPSPGLSLA